ncbi:transcriptional regulator, AraC family [Neorhodopirellula lusitana]|uniref:Transcriptional regulator, AraC family n=1 Tax=Neorhodopirellula lusitana TaxID=445327 RepID=A0ABY1Q140_9BACT|nr:AraC family transcriptional regulator [Neorhodopirellula lusitana]SMP54537.1 transcriptional regulator, AraC family [Neorhodopirellula lusitana]
MKPTFEKLVTNTGESFRCFDRENLNTPVRWHRHPEIELTYLRQGTGSRIVGDHIGSYGDHDLVLVGGNLPHNWASDAFRGQKFDNHPAIVVQFRPDFLGTDFFRTPELAGVANLLDRSQRGLWFPTPIARQVGEQMTAMVDSPGAAKVIGLLTCLDQLAQVSDAQPLSSEAYQFSASPVGEDRIQAVCDFIEFNLTNPKLSHQALANLVDMNPSAFSRFFRQSTGRTLTEHIVELRIGLACRMLAETDQPVLAISLEAGFANLSNFNRRFRELRQMTPREYRQCCHDLS